MLSFPGPASLAFVTLVSGPVYVLEVGRCGPHVPVATEARASDLPVLEQVLLERAKGAILPKFRSPVPRYMMDAMLPTCLEQVPVEAVVVCVPLTGPTDLVELAGLYPG